MIIKPRCVICSSKFGCSHAASKQKQWSDEVHLIDVSLGEPLTDITNPEKILQEIKSLPNNDTAKKTMNATDINRVFVKCNFCQHEVLQTFLTRHIGTHIENKYLEDANAGSGETQIRIAGSNSYISPKENLAEVKLDDVRNFLNAIPMSKVKDLDLFSFKKIKDVSAFSGTSKNGRYSDFTLLIWFAESISSYNGAYSGGHSSYYGKFSERLQVHLTYDSLERYFTISARVYKRGGYTDYETEEAAIPDRICEQEELMAEMRKIFLFFRLPPKAIHKRFMKLFRQGFQLIYCENTPSQAVTVNHMSILDDLKKGKFVTSSQDVDDCYGY